MDGAEHLEPLAHGLDIDFDKLDRDQLAGMLIYAFGLVDAINEVNRHLWRRLQAQGIIDEAAGTELVGWLHVLGQLMMAADETLAKYCSGEAEAEAKGRLN